MSDLGKCIIVGAGDLTVGTMDRQEDDFVIAVDGGLDYCPFLNLEPDLIIGDFDSVSEENTAAIKELEQKIPERILRLPVEKDDTDMLAALKEGLKRGYRDFRIYAGCGGRLDHTIANLQCLLYLKNHGAVGYLIGADSMIFLIHNEEITLKNTLEGTLSLFSMGEHASGVSIEGMKYCLSDAEITNDFPIGISNEFVGETARIKVEFGTLLCMITYAE